MKYFCLVIFLLLSGQSHAATDLALPRFVSIKSDEVNMRTGPGLRYQIKWIVRRKHLPLEVIAEFEEWRKVRDMHGDEGWLHYAMLSNNRTVMLHNEQVLLKKPEKNAPPVAKLESGVVAVLDECTTDYCQIELEDYQGWVERSAVWGVYPEEWQREE